LVKKTAFNIILTSVLNKTVLTERHFATQLEKITRNIEKYFSKKSKLHFSFSQLPGHFSSSV